MNTRLNDRPEALAIFRIFLVLFLLIQYVQNLEYFDLFHGQFSIPAINLATAPDWPLWFDGLACWAGVEKTVLMRDANTIYGICLIFLLLGCGTRLAAIVALVIQVTLKHESYTLAYGAYDFATIGLFYCCVLPVSDSISLRALRGSTLTPSKYYFLSYCVLRGHMSVVYVSAALAKFGGAQWFNGEALWRALARPSALGEHVYWLHEYPWLPMALGWFVVALQLSYPLFLVSSTYRMRLLVLIEMLHLGIAVSLGLWVFSGLMLALNFGALLDSTYVRRWIDRFLSIELLTPRLNNQLVRARKLGKLAPHQNNKAN